MKRVEEHTPCATCGYDLIGLSLSAVCPECGSAVRGSVQRRSIVGVPRGRARRWILGLRMIALSICVLVAWPVVWIIAGFAVNRIGGATVAGVLMAWWIALAAYLFGYVLLAGRDVVRGRSGSLCVVGLVLGLALVGGAVWWLSTPFSPPISGVVAIWVCFAVTIALSAHGWGAVGLLDQRARYMGRGWSYDQIEEWIGHARAIVVIAGALGFLCCVSVLTGAPAALAGAAAMSIPLFVVLGVYAVFGAWYCWQMARAWSLELSAWTRTESP